MKWKISNVKIDNQLVLAPMADICDSTFRRIVKSMGCGLLETEMISDKSIIQLNSKTREMLYRTDYEKPLSLQLLGSDIESLTIASKYVEKYVEPDIIDINMGCPVNKVAVRGHSGSGLLKEPDKIYDIVSNLVDTISLPITAKIRSGWDDNCINAVENAKIIEEAGASAITVHPRTRTQGYSGKSDWSVIKDVKDNVSIPVIGNGDIQTCYDAKRMIDETNCDAVMIGRGVLGNPWLIRECVEYLDYGIEPMKITSEDKINMIKEHMDLLIESKGEMIALIKMRKHAAYYVKGLYRSGEIKQKIFQTKSKEELFNLLEEYQTILI